MKSLARKGLELLLAGSIISFAYGASLPEKTGYMANRDSAVVEQKNKITSSSLSDSDAVKAMKYTNERVFLKHGDISYHGLEHLTGLKDKNGKPLLGIDDIILMQQTQSDFVTYPQDITTDYEEMSKYITQLVDVFDKSGINYSLDKEKIIRYTQLRLPIKDIIFKDTEKPNALIVYPIIDNGSYYNIKDGIKFLKNVISGYDVQLIIAKDENEVYNAIDYVPNIEFLCLAGHGTKHNLILSKEREKGEIDTSDSELADHLRKLNPDAVIYLLSCSTGEGGSKELNLANKIAEWSDNKKVISFTTIMKAGSRGFTSKRTLGGIYDLIKSYYPFDMLKNDSVYSNK
jgi:hypothetical protein